MSAGTELAEIPNSRKTRSGLCQIGRGYQGMIESETGSDANRVPVIYINVPPDRDRAGGIRPRRRDQQQARFG